jgi:5-methylcytosine-specific restriction endonuclease McrA
MIRKGKRYFPEEILPLVETTGILAVRKELDGDLINFGTKRLQVFAKKGLTCARCGTIGEFFVKEKHNRQAKYWHLGCYALDGDGNWVMMTRDHIIPRNRGGSDSLSNSQVLCFPCNQEKADKPWAIH